MLNVYHTILWVRRPDTYSILVNILCFIVPKSVELEHLEIYGWANYNYDAQILANLKLPNLKRLSLEGICGKVSIK